MTGLQVGLMFSGVLVVEQVFGWPGIGQYIAQSIPVADFPAIAGVTLVLGVVYVVINTVVDILQAVADPRIDVLICHMSRGQQVPPRRRADRSSTARGDGVDCGVQTFAEGARLPDPRGPAGRRAWTWPSAARHGTAPPPAGPAPTSGREAIRAVRLPRLARGRVTHLDVRVDPLRAADGASTTATPRC